MQKSKLPRSRTSSLRGRQFKSQNWQKKKLGEILEVFESGSRPKGGVRHILYGIPSIGAEHLSDNGRFNLDNVKFVPIEFYKKLKRGFIKQGDILIVKDGATTGKVSLADQSFPFSKAVVNEHVFILRPDKNQILGKFLFRFLFSKSGQAQILETFHGAAQGGINSDFVNHVKIPLPSLSEQKKIVEKIEKFFAKIDEASCLRAESSAASAALLPSALHQIFNSKIKIQKSKLQFKSQNWQTKKLGEIANCTDGDWILSRDLKTGREVRLIQLGDIGKGIFLDKTDKWISKKRCKELKCTILKTGDVLLARLGDPLGKTCIFPGFDYPCITAVDVTIIRVGTETESRFLLQYLNAQAFKKQVYEVASGATRKRISRKNLENLKIPIPSIAEQKKIVVYLDALSQKTRELQNLQTQTATDFSALRQSVLAKAFEQL